MFSWPSLPRNKLNVLLKYHSYNDSGYQLYYGLNRAFLGPLAKPKHHLNSVCRNLVRDIVSVCTWSSHLSNGKMCLQCFLFACFSLCPIGVHFFRKNDYIH